MILGSAIYTPEKLKQHQKLIGWDSLPDPSEVAYSTTLAPLARFHRVAHQR